MLELGDLLRHRRRGCRLAVLHRLSRGAPGRLGDLPLGVFFVRLSRLALWREISRFCQVLVLNLRQNRRRLKLSAYGEFRPGLFVVSVSMLAKRWRSWTFPCRSIGRRNGS
jgi:hypothetical protein